MLPQIGRYNDIFASIVAQKIMRGLNLQVHFGKPFVWQQRNKHNLVTDLKNELWGYENIWPIAGHIDRLVLPLGNPSVIDKLRDIYLAVDPYLPGGVLPLANCWLDECQKLLSPS